MTGQPKPFFRLTHPPCPSGSNDDDDAPARDARRTDVEIDVDDNEDDDEGEPLLDENAGDAPSRGRDEDDRGS